MSPADGGGGTHPQDPAVLNFLVRRSEFDRLEEQLSLVKTRLSKLENVVADIRAVQHDHVRDLQEVTEKLQRASDKVFGNGARGISGEMEIVKQKLQLLIWVGATIGGTTLATLTGLVIRSVAT